MCYFNLDGNRCETTVDDSQFEYYKRPDRCQDVACPLPAACKQLATCLHGKCNYANAVDGAGCDDGFVFTDRDTCIGGKCRGRLTVNSFITLITVNFPAPDDADKAIVCVRSSLAALLVKWESSSQSMSIHSVDGNGMVVLKARFEKQENAEGFANATSQLTSFNACTLTIGEHAIVVDDAEAAQSVCGDGAVGPAETCDDAALVDRDGCDSRCNVEAG